VKLGAVFQQRHDAAHQKARSLVLAGEIGHVVMARVLLSFAAVPPAATAVATENWRSDPNMRPGGIVMGAGDHAYDTLCYITGQQIEEVFAYTDSSQEFPPNEQVASVLLKLSGGAIGYAGASRRTPFGQEAFAIHGSTGSIALYNTYGFMAGTEDSDPRPRVELTTARGKTVQIMEQADCFRLELEQFNRAILGKAEPMTTAWEGLVNQAITEAIYLSASSGRAVRISGMLPAGM
jgi:predicted dehydrogenase